MTKTVGAISICHCHAYFLQCISQGCASLKCSGGETDSSTDTTQMLNTVSVIKCKLLFIPRTINCAFINFYFTIESQDFSNNFSIKPEFDLQLEVSRIPATHICASFALRECDSGCVPFRAQLQLWCCHEDAEYPGFCYPCQCPFWSWCRQEDFQSSEPVSSCASELWGSKV